MNYETVNKVENFQRNNFTSISEKFKYAVLTGRSTYESLDLDGLMAKPLLKYTNCEIFQLKLQMMVLRSLYASLQSNYRECRFDRVSQQFMQHFN